MVALFINLDIKNQQFSLIGFTYVNANPGYIEKTDFNLVTGEKIMEHFDYETNRLFKKEIIHKKVPPLPTLQNFASFDYMY